MTERERDTLKESIHDAELDDTELDEVAGGACDSGCKNGCMQACTSGGSGGTELE